MPLIIQSIINFLLFFVTIRCLEGWERQDNYNELMEHMFLYVLYTSSFITCCWNEKKDSLLFKKIFSRRCTNQKMTHMISHWDKISKYISTTPLKYILTENYIYKKISDFKTSSDLHHVWFIYFFKFLKIKKKTFLKI